MPYAIDRLLKTPVTRTRLPSRKPMAAPPSAQGIIGDDLLTVTLRAVTAQVGSATLPRHANQGRPPPTRARHCRCGLRIGMERSLSGRRPRQELPLQLVHRPAEDARPGALLHLRRMGLHPADLRAAVAVPLPQAALRARAAIRARAAACAAARRGGAGATAGRAALRRGVH